MGIPNQPGGDLLGGADLHTAPSPAPDDKPLLALPSAGVAACWLVWLMAQQLQSRYREACERSRHVVSNTAGLDQPSVKALRDGRHYPLR